MTPGAYPPPKVYLTKPDKLLIPKRTRQRRQKKKTATAIFLDLANPNIISMSQSEVGTSDCRAVFIHRSMDSKTKRRLLATFIHSGNKYLWSIACPEPTVDDCMLFILVDKQWKFRTCQPEMGQLNDILPWAILFFLLRYDNLSLELSTLMKGEDNYVYILYNLELMYSFSLHST